MNYIYDFKKYTLLEGFKQDEFYTDIALQYYNKVKKALKNKEYEAIPNYDGYFIKGKNIDNFLKNLIILFVPESNHLLKSKDENKTIKGALGRSGDYDLLVFGNLLEPNNDKYIDSRLNVNLFVHEFIHLLDKKRYGKSYKGFKNINSDIHTYYNSPEEFNAYYQESSFSIKKFFFNNKINKEIISKFLKTFEDFKKLAFRFFDKDFIENINQKYKNKLNKRLYNMYINIKEKLYEH